ncbi:hypothetical protein AB0P21_03035 [Kribbella sp. NPDC056861]|uniref:hypothetical protein n=1 Tax=Kribbella sp. NPDC056861 TaxID=3154857 RepID=UPI003425F27E
MTSPLAAVISALNAPDGAPLLIPSDRHQETFPETGTPTYNFDDWLATRVS